MNLPKQVRQFAHIAEKTDAEAISAERLRAEGDAAGADSAEREALSSFLGEHLCEWTDVAKWGKVQNRILIVNNAKVLGDFINRLLLGATIKRQFKSAELTMLYEKTTFSEALIRVCPDLYETINMAGAPITLPWERLIRYSLIFPPKGLPFKGFLPHFDHIAMFKVPAESMDLLRHELTLRGVNVKRWFAVIHYRQGSTFTRSVQDSRRDVDPANFHEIARYICEELGGQVLRLGHDGMDPIPNMPGYVDLSAIPFDLQISAIASARFMVATDSGPVALGSAFRTPTAKTNALFEEGVLFPHDLLLPKNVVNWKGEVLSLGKLFRDRPLMLNLMLDQANRGFAYKAVDNNFTQLKYCVDCLYSETMTCDGWRTERAGGMGPCPNELNWPNIGKRGARLLDLSGMLGLPLREVTI